MIVIRHRPVSSVFLLLMLFFVLDSSAAVRRGAETSMKNAGMVAGI